MATANVQSKLATEVGNYFISNYPPYSCWNREHNEDFVESLELSPADETALGLYVHLPFCRQRCTYCYFRVYTRVPEQQVDAYIDAVLQEASLYRGKPILSGRSLSCAYFGGGTPTYLTVEQLKRLLGGLQERLSWDELRECTIECDPASTTREKLLALRALGVTRISLGFQSLDEKILRGVGRSVSVEDCLRAFACARECGFDEINIDLLAGLPGETADSWRQTVEKVGALRPECVTVYQMELTYNSAVYAGIKAGRTVSLPTWPQKRALAAHAFEQLEGLGYTVVSGYMALRRPESWKFVYTIDVVWRGQDLLALGESSFGHFQGWHYQNVANHQEYLALVSSGRLPLWRCLPLDDEERLRRELILLLKTGSVEPRYFWDKYGIDVRTHFSQQWQELSEAGLIEREDETAIALTRDGLMCVDQLLPRFYLPQHRGIRYA